jgi:threonine/homoserine/homoserine lactone efflux protein
MAALALVANVCYCAAYVVDVAMIHSSLASVWRRRRWILWLVGTLFAIALASYWIADEIYPDFH